MNPLIIFRVQNGWLVTTEDGVLNDTEIAACHVFADYDLQGLVKHIEGATSPDLTPEKRSEAGSQRYA